MEPSHRLKISINKTYVYVSKENYILLHIFQWNWKIESLLGIWWKFQLVLPMKWASSEHIMMTNVIRLIKVMLIIVEFLILIIYILILRVLHTFDLGLCVWNELWLIRNFNNLHFHFCTTFPPKTNWSSDVIPYLWNKIFILVYVFVKYDKNPSLNI